MIASAEEFRRLRTSEDPREYGRAAREEAALETWREVVRRYPDLRFWVAQNKTVPGEILAVLAGDPDPQVREMVARKRSLTEAMAVMLAHDADATVRAALTFNRRLPGRALEMLRADPAEFVRERVRLREQRG